MITLRMLTIAMLPVVGLVGCASRQNAVTPGVTESAAVMDTPSGGAAAASTVTVTAVVESVDLSKRLVTLRGPDGNLVTIHADERVRNLPQVKKGDQVSVTYYESIAIDVLKPGEAQPGVAVAGDVVTAKPGDKPGAAGAQTVTVTATITAIDRATQHVTLRGPEGNSTTIRVRDPKRLEGVQVGDLVQVTYTEAVAIAVEAAGS